MSSMTIHDVTGITISPTTHAEGHSWQKVIIKSKVYGMDAEGEYREVEIKTEIAMHCAKENRPIDILVPEFNTNLTS